MRFDYTVIFTVGQGPTARRSFFMIYLDHAATTPVPRAVADAMYDVLT